MLTNFRNFWNFLNKKAMGWNFLVDYLSSSKTFSNNSLFNFQNLQYFIFGKTICDLDGLQDLHIVSCKYLNQTQKLLMNHGAKF